MTAKSKPAPPVRNGLEPAEVQRLADTALLTWEKGVEVELLDSKGDGWRMLPERSATSGLWLYRTPADVEGAEPIRRFVNAADLGVEQVRAMLAALILGMAEPA